MNLKELENYLQIQPTFIRLINLQEFDRLNPSFCVCRTAAKVVKRTGNIRHCYRGDKTPACITNHTVESKRAGQLLCCKANSALGARCSNSHVRWAVYSQQAACGLVG